MSITMLQSRLNSHYFSYILFFNPFKAQSHLVRRFFSFLLGSDFLRYSQNNLQPRLILHSIEIFFPEEKSLLNLTQDVF